MHNIIPVCRLEARSQEKQARSYQQTTILKKRKKRKRKVLSRSIMSIEELLWSCWDLQPLYREIWYLSLLENKGPSSLCRASMLITTEHQNLRGTHRLCLLMSDHTMLVD